MVARRGNGHLMETTYVDSKALQVLHDEPLHLTVDRGACRRAA